MDSESVRDETCAGDVEVELVSPVASEVNEEDDIFAGAGVDYDLSGDSGSDDEAVVEPYPASTDEDEAVVEPYPASEEDEAVVGPYPASADEDEAVVEPYPESADEDEAVVEPYPESDEDEMGLRI
ncbi:hypothetical protein IWW35_005456 [Coemansia sp. RSA 1878]|nr:hypothetical protein IWW35_005456 [Coemansia sp. RSA 1878]